ncbi:MAG: glycosyltransferase [Pseudomonadales bacterium]|nr:glycosyltransferase [Pseudomonadales bacterium]
MKKANRSLLVISKDASGSSTRYRAGQFLPGLEAAGWQIKILVADSDLVVRGQMLQAAACADVVLVLRKTFGPVTSWLLRRAARRLIFDFDDAVFLASNGKSSITRYRRFVRMVSRCDQVWAGNSFLAEAASQHNASTRVMPTVVDEVQYRRVGEGKFESQTVDLVWIGSSSTRKYLEKLRPVLNRLASLRSDLRLKIVADFELADLEMPQVRIDWSEQVEAQALTSAHIGIAPMIDNPWTRGKCGLKVLQYMAASLPVVTDMAGVNQQMVVNGRTGLVVSDDDQWVEAIIRLADDFQLQLEFGNTGRQRLIDLKYTVGSNLREMNSYLEFL